jgi:hypothetical protein
MLANNTLGLSQSNVAINLETQRETPVSPPIRNAIPYHRRDRPSTLLCITTFHSNFNRVILRTFQRQTARAAAGQSRSPSFRSYIITIICTASKEPSANGEFEQCIIIQKHEYLQIWRPRKNSENSHRSAENLHLHPRPQLQQ